MKPSLLQKLMNLTTATQIYTSSCSSTGSSWATCIIKKKKKSEKTKINEWLFFGIFLLKATTILLFSSVKFTTLTPDPQAAVQSYFSDSTKKNNKTSRISCKFLSHFHNTVLLFGLFFLFFLLSFSQIASTATAKITQAKQRHSIILVLAKKNTENQATKQNAWASPFSSLSTDWNFNYFPLNIAQQLETQVEND